MAKTVVIDELHVTVRVPSDLPDAQTEAIRHTLEGDDFMTRLRRSIRAAVQVFPELAVVRMSLTR